MRARATGSANGNGVRIERAAPMSIPSPAVLAQFARKSNVLRLACAALSHLELREWLQSEHARVLPGQSNHRRAQPVPDIKPPRHPENRNKYFVLVNIILAVSSRPRNDIGPRADTLELDRTRLNTPAEILADFGKATKRRGRRGIFATTNFHLLHPIHVHTGN